MLTYNRGVEKFVRVLIASIAIACRSDPQPDRTVERRAVRPLPAGTRWTIQRGWNGGKPPGSRFQSIVSSDGHYTSSGDAEPSGVKSHCETVLAPAVIQPLGELIARTDPANWKIPDERGSIRTTFALTIGDESIAYQAMPSDPALNAALDAVSSAAETQCTTHAVGSAPP
ncbi:MAG: hypothetical protein JWO36_4075 [Myxococcales bacterium]|nr:hypothetical protein [Myxococcales bacterium]